MDVLRSNRSASKGGSYGDVLRTNRYTAEARVTGGASELGNTNATDADSMNSQESQAMIIKKQTSYQVTYADESSQDIRPARPIH